MAEICFRRISARVDSFFRRTIQLRFVLQISLSVLLGGIIGSSAPAQQLSEQQWKRGFQGFSVIASGVGLQHETFERWRQAPPNEKMIVLMGSLDESRMNSVVSFVDRGGAALIATDQPNTGLRRSLMLDFSRWRSGRLAKKDRFNELVDCPIVSDFEPHPSLRGVKALITNRPGQLKQRLLAFGLNNIAYLPVGSRGRRPVPFISVVDDGEGGRLMCISDHSLFSNQMITYGDNALFLQQALQWLGDGKRKHLLVMINGEVIQAVDFSDLDIQPPAPSHAEIMAILKQLPPDALLDVGNSIATIVEDDNMVNEFAYTQLEKINPVLIDRFFVFLLAGIATAIMIVIYSFQKKLMRQTSSEIASQRWTKQSSRNKRMAALDRQMAAEVLLDSLCLDVAQCHYRQWGDFANQLPAADDPQTVRVLKSISRVDLLYRHKSASYWTKKRLEKLATDVDRWKAFFLSQAKTDKTESNEITYQGQA